MNHQNLHSKVVKLFIKSPNWRHLLALSGLLMLLVSFKAPVFLPYVVFVLAYLRGWQLPQFGPPWVRFLAATLISAAILETSSWLSEFIQNSPQPALLHPQLIPDLLTSIGFYAGWWLSWWLILRYYRFTAAQVFVTTGLYGILIEQQGNIFLAGIQSLPWGLWIWLLVFMTYGSTMALAFWLVRNQFSATRDARIKYPLAWGGLFIMTILTSLIWGLILQTLDIIPPPKLPMRNHPLW